MMNPFFQQSTRRILSRTSRKQSSSSSSSSSWTWKTTKVGLVTGTTVVGTGLLTELYSDYQELKQQQLATKNNDDPTTTTTTNPYSLPRSYDRQAIRNYWIRRPVSVVSRLANISYELCPSLVSYLYYTLWLSKQQTYDDSKLEESKSSQAVRLREALTNLGPAFVKAGQQLAIRPDLVPPIVLKELQKLCDSVRPIPDTIALQLLETELFGTPCHSKNNTASDDTKNNMTTKTTRTLDDVFEDLHLVASASLGQVYKAKLKESGEYVAIKVRDVKTNNIHNYLCRARHQTSNTSFLFHSIFVCRSNDRECKRHLV
jgi:hypothetical protein